MAQNFTPRPIALSTADAASKYGPGGALYPEQFNAKGNGTTDDTNALIAAITEASATKLPLILQRRYLFSTIDLQKSDVSMLWRPGALMLSSVDKVTDVQTFRLRGSRILLDRPTFDFTVPVNIDTDGHNRAGGADTIRLGGLSSVNAAEDIEVIGGLVLNSRNTPLRVRFARAVRFTGFRCKEALGNGIMFENVRDGRILQCTTYRTGDDGIVALAGNADYLAGYSGDIDVLMNHIYKSYANGINYTGVDGGVIGSNIIDETWAPGVRVWKDSTFGLGSCSDIEILPNIIRRAGTYFGAGKYHETVNAVPHGVYMQGGVERVRLHPQSVVAPQGKSIVTVGGGVQRVRGASLPPTLGTGQFISQTGVATGATALVPDRLYATPFIISDAAVVTSLNVNCTLAAAGSAVRLGIFADDASVAGALLLDAGTVDTTTLMPQVFTPRPGFAPATVSPEGGVRAVGKGELVINVADYGIEADNGVTDNSPLLTALLAAAPEGAVLHFPPRDTNWYGFASRVIFDKAVTCVGNWTLPTQASAKKGAVLRPTTADAQLAMRSMFEVGVGRAKFRGLALVGRPTKETNATVALNGTLVQLSSLTARTALVGARVSGPFVPDGTTVASIDTGANTVTLSTPTVTQPITAATSTASTLTITFRGAHDLPVGSVITLAGFTPSGWNGTWTVASVPDFQSVTITSTANPGVASSIGTWSSSLTGETVWFGGDGIRYTNENTGKWPHLSEAMDCLVVEFNAGHYFGVNSDHISVVGGGASGYDSVVFGAGNQNDFELRTIDLTGSVRSGLRLAADTSVTNVRADRAHFGPSQFGIYQDVTTAFTRGFFGLSLISTPIEYVGKAHIRIEHGGDIFIDPSCYWTWDSRPEAQKPAQPAFAINGTHAGAIRWWPQTVGTNPNCPYIFVAGVQSNGSTFESNRTAASLSGFATTLLRFSAYNSLNVPGSAFFNGNVLQTGPSTQLTVAGSLRGHRRSIATSGANLLGDFLVSCTATLTLTLTGPSGANLILMVTNESASGTVTLAVASGTYAGPATIAAGHGATFIYDGTNWRCVGAY